MIGKFECEIDLTKCGYDSPAIANLIRDEIRSEISRAIKQLVREQVATQKDGILKRIQATLDAIEIDVAAKGGE